MCKVNTPVQFQVYYDIRTLLNCHWLFHLSMKATNVVLHSLHFHLIYATIATLQYEQSRKSILNASSMPPRSSE